MSWRDISREVPCPRCLAPIDATKTANLRRGNRCIRCGAEVRVADTYARVLSVLSLVIGVALMGGFGFLVLNIFVFSPLMWFLVLMVMVRVAPYIVPPTLEFRDSGSITTLDLTDRAGEDHKTNPLS